MHHSLVLFFWFVCFNGVYFFFFNFIFCVRLFFCFFLFVELFDRSFSRRALLPGVEILGSQCASSACSTSPLRRQLWPASMTIRPNGRDVTCSGHVMFLFALRAPAAVSDVCMGAPQVPAALCRDGNGLLDWFPSHRGFVAIVAREPIIMTEDTVQRRFLAWE